MSNTLQNPKKGDFVYPLFCPQRVGVIVEHTPCANVLTGNTKIKTINGKTFTYPESSLRNFHSLIEDHKKKLATHLSNLEKLKKIAAEQSKYFLTLK
jgi:hypothetical protein